MENLVKQLCENQNFERLLKYIRDEEQNIGSCNSGGGGGGGGGTGGGGSGDCGSCQVG